jgi:hypothetical protein
VPLVFLSSRILNEFTEDGVFLAEVTGRGAIPRSRSYRNERQEDVQLHSNVTEMTVPADKYSVSASI